MLPPPVGARVKYVQPVNNYNQAVKLANSYGQYNLRYLIEGMPPGIGPGYFVWIWRRDNAQCPSCGYKLEG